MPDISLRFHKDMLTMSSPLEPTLRRAGFDMAFGIDLMCALEPEAVHEALNLQHAAGAPCMVTPTNGITVARLAHHRAAEKQVEIAQAAKRAVLEFKPQHAIAEIGPTGLPIDPSSATSLKANRDQYAAAVRAFGAEGIDAFFLNGMVSLDDMRCAIMGARMVCDTPIIASLNVDAQGSVAERNQPIEEAASVMEDLEASVVGFRTAAAPEAVLPVLKRVCAATELPVLVQLEVGEQDKRQYGPTLENPYYTPDTMMRAAALLRAGGAQVLRAVGNATPAYAGALSVACMGLDCIR